MAAAWSVIPPVPINSTAFLIRRNTATTAWLRVLRTPETAPWCDGRSWLACTASVPRFKPPNSLSVSSAASTRAKIDFAAAKKRGRPRSAQCRGRARLSDVHTITWVLIGRVALCPHVFISMPWGPSSSQPNSLHIRLYLTNVTMPPKPTYRFLNQMMSLGLRMYNGEMAMTFLSVSLSDNHGATHHEHEDRCAASCKYRSLQGPNETFALIKMDSGTLHSIKLGLVTVVLFASACVVETKARFLV